MELRHAALQAFAMDSPADKIAAVQALAQWHLPLDSTAHLQGPTAPGRPAQPVLVEPQQVARRSPYTPAGHAALMHAVAHIEFNAINLALDAAWRFGGMPTNYYLDWLRVAAEETKHFTLLRTHLQSVGYDYGDFPAHTGLWDMTHKTAGDVLARMALVPRTLEARGLDATPLMQTKLRKVGTPDSLAAVAILDIILRDEIGHVAIGNHWYRHLCSERGVDPITTYAALAKQYGAPHIKGPLNLDARRAAGFDEAELALLDTSPTPTSAFAHP